MEENLRKRLEVLADFQKEDVWEEGTGLASLVSVSFEDLGWLKTLWRFHKALPCTIGMVAETNVVAMARLETKRSPFLQALVPGDVIFK